jgi:hypothetical protein
MTEIVESVRADSADPVNADPVNDRVGTEINDSSGPIHAGSGDQLNDINVYLDRQRKARTWEITPVRLEQLRDRFVSPPNLTRAADLLAQPEGLVILSGVAGTGRGTAGLMLLSASGTPGTAVRLVPPDLEPRATQAGRRIFEGSDVREDDRLLLDLSEVDAASFIELQDYLHALQHALLQRRAKLVVVLPHLHGERLRADFVSFVVEIGRPDMLEVLKRQLSAHGLQLENTFRYRKTFASASMADLVRVVLQLRDARQDRPQADADLLLAEVLSSEERRKQKVVGVVQSAKEARPRGLLIAAALLHGLSAQDVFLAQHRLLEMLRTTDDDGDHPLELAGVAESLGSLSLDLRVAPGPGQRLRFADHEIATDVLQHFWDDMPWLRGRLTDWVGELVRAGSLDRFEIPRIAQRFGEQCRRTHQAELALRLVEQWSGDRYQSQRSAAYTLLEDLLYDDRTASSARQLLYTWARDTHLPGGRAAIVVAACVNILVDGYLDQAVVRLSWLSKHSDSSVRHEAREGLGRLAKEPGNRLKVIDMVLEPWRFEPANFAAVAAPSGLWMFEGSESVERIVAGWQRALRDTEPFRRGVLLRRWLHAYAGALADGRPQEAQSLQQILAMVCTNQPELLDALFNTTLDWLEERGEDPLRLRTAQAIEGLVRRVRRTVGRTVLEAGS